MRFLAAVLCAFILAGCSSRHHQPVEGPGDGIVDRELSRSRAEILSRLSELRDVTSPSAPAFASNAQAPADMSYAIGLTWQGPLEKGVSAVALRIGWKARRYGRPPAQDIIVACDGSDTAFDAIQRFQMQAGSRARIVIDEQAKTLKVDYRSDIPSGRRGHGRHGIRRPHRGHRHATRAAANPSRKPTLQQPQADPQPQPQPQPQAAPAPAPAPETRAPVKSPVIDSVRPRTRSSDSLVRGAFGR